MMEIKIVVEGQTELAFVKEVLAPYLGERAIAVYARKVLTSINKRQSRQYRGGISSYAKAKNDIISWLKQGKKFILTTMFDLYGLPNDFPSFHESCSHMDPYTRIKILEEKFKQDINDVRFVPYIQLHEFEALILADPQKLQKIYLSSGDGIAKLIRAVNEKGGNPELVNDSPQTAPSKRISGEIPAYDKAIAGPEITRAIGIPVLRKRCVHFNEWLTKLEQLAGINP